MNTLTASVTESGHGYRSGYEEPLPVEDQIDILRSHWPNLDPDPCLRYLREARPAPRLPALVEGLFALIRPGFFSPDYGTEVREIFEALTRSRKGEFKNYRDGQLGYLYQSWQRQRMAEKLARQQPGSDIVLIAAQLGSRRTGQPVCRVCAIFEPDESGLCARDVATMLITHPGRLKRPNDLHIDCAGDGPIDIDQDADVVPYFGFRETLEFGFSPIDAGSVDWGSATGFVLQ